IQTLATTQTLATDIEFARAAYTVAFREYGLNIESADTAELSAAVRGSPIAVPLAAALDAWLSIGGPPKLLDLVDRLDPEPSHIRLRRAFADKDAKTIAATVSKLDGRTLPPAFAQYVGR